MAEDGRRNNGGNKNAGRKPKEEEQKIRKLGIDAIVKIYGSVEEYYEHIAKQSKDSFNHLRLLQEYVFGKPKESLDLTTGDNPIQNFNLGNLSDSELSVILKLYARQPLNTDGEPD